MRCAITTRTSAGAALASRLTALGSVTAPQALADAPLESCVTAQPAGIIAQSSYVTAQSRGLTAQSMGGA